MRHPLLITGMSFLLSWCVYPGQEYYAYNEVDTVIILEEKCQSIKPQPLT